MKPDGSSQHSYEPTTCPCPEPDQSSPCPPSHISMIHFNILPSKPGSSKCFLRSGVHDRVPYISTIFRVTKSRRLRWAGHVARMTARRGVYRVLVGKPERRRTLGRPRLRWEDTIKVDVREMEWEAWTGSI